MNDEKIQVMQEVSSRLNEKQYLKWMHDHAEEIDAKMQEIRQQDMNEEEELLKELPEEAREEAFMVLE